MSLRNRIFERFLSAILIFGILVPVPKVKAQAVDPAMAADEIQEFVTFLGSAEFANIVGNAFIISGYVSDAATSPKAPTSASAPNANKIIPLLLSPLSVIQNMVHEGKQAKKDLEKPWEELSKTTSETKKDVTTFLNNASQLLEFAQDLAEAVSGTSQASVSRSANPSATGAEFAPSTTSLLEASPMSYVTPFTAIVRPMEAPEKPFHLEEVIPPEVIASLFNGKNYVYHYDKRLRYNRQSEWGAFNPDIVKSWVLNPAAANNSTILKRIQDELGKTLTSKAHPVVASTLEALDHRIPRPVGYSEAALDKPLEAITDLLANHDYHNMIDGILDLQQEARELIKDPAQKELGEYWNKELHRRFIQPNGVLRQLIVSRTPVHMNSETAAGQAAAGKISHILLTIKTLDTAWSYHAQKEHLLDMSKAENIVRIRNIGVARELFLTVTDKVIGDLIEEGNSVKESDSKNDPLVERYIKFGRDLEVAKQPLEFEIQKFNEEIAPKIFHDTTEIEHFENWRKLDESIKQKRDVTVDRDFHYGVNAETLRAEDKPNVETTSPVTETEKVTPAGPNVEESKTEETPQKAETEHNEVVKKKVDLWRHKNLVRKLRELFKREDISKNLGDVLEVLEISSSEDFNEEVKEKFSTPPAEKGGIRIKAEVKSDWIDLVRAYKEKFNIEFSNWFSFEKDLYHPDGTRLTEEEFAEKMDMPEKAKIDGAKRIRVFRGTKINISLTSGEVSGGSSGQLQIYIEPNELGNAEVNDWNFGK